MLITVAYPINSYAIAKNHTAHGGSRTIEEEGFITKLPLIKGRQLLSRKLELAILKSIPSSLNTQAPAQF
jgi:hypothetical protein